MNTQTSIEHIRKCKAKSEPRFIRLNNSANETHGVCHDNFRINKEQSMLIDCQRLFERKEPLDKPDKYGITLLHIAAAKSYENVIRFLLQHHVNVDRVDDTGATALHLCAKHEQGAIVKLLLDAHATPTIRDRFGRKPSEVCSSNSLIRAVLQKAEIKFEEKRKRAEQSDDSLEDEPEVTIDSLSDDEINDINEHDDDLYILFKPIPQKQQTLNCDVFDSDWNQSKIMDLFNAKLKSSDDHNTSIPAKLPNDDLASLPEITEHSLLYDLEIRYRQGQIYTYIGDILIALNPFDNIPIYSRQASELYKNTQSIASLPPHIYGCAERIYRNMLRERKSQCVVISGLSGSGKTESCKYLVQHILSRSLSLETALNRKINQVNPLMEAFGNAKTYINNNSSRFGKYLEIHFSPNGNVLGALLKEYLLEKSRVICHNSDEGNFHIFYYLFAGLSHELLVRNGLRMPSEHRYMSHNPELAHLDSAREIEYRKRFHMVKQSLISIGFSIEDVQSIFTILSAILHIGDVSFVPHGSNDGVRVKNNSTVDKIAELLQLSSMEFSSALVTELQITRGEQILRERNLIQAAECRDAFAKALYGRLFSWIVNGINSYLQPLHDDSNLAHTISVLDIFGFENFKYNSFEQLCINLTNEHMQRFLNQHIYDWEILDCKQEGIETIDIHYTDNNHVIDTFLNKHSGLLAILDEESRFPHATDQTLATKLHHGPGVHYSDIYIVPKDGGTTFTIRHYAAPVVYNIVGLLEKNRDFLPNSIVFVARTSNNVLIQELFRSNLNEKGVLPPTKSLQNHHLNTFHGNRDFKRHEPIVNSNGKPLLLTQQANRTFPEKNNGNTFERTGGTAMRTVAFHFKHSLNELIDKMNVCQCHFIWCIKPNEIRDKSTSVAVPCVTRQLRYSGVLQMCEIRKKGYPLRILFHEFLNRYNSLAICLLPINVDDRSKELSLSSSIYYRDRAIECLKRAGIDNYKVGHTKLLFRYWHSDQLHNLAVQYEKRVNVCQKVLRGWLARRKYARLREVHQLQLVFIRKFSDDVFVTGQLYKTKMEDQIQYDRKRKLKPKLSDEDDEQQIEKTLNYFDSILDPYLSDHDVVNDENKHRRSSIPQQTKSTNHSNGHVTKQEFEGNVSTNTSSSSSSSSTGSSSQKLGQRPVDIHASHFHQFQNIRCRFEQMTSTATNPPTNIVRRYTSENNLNEINSTPKVNLQQKPSRLQPVQSTEDLTNIPSWKKLSPQARLSALLDTTNHPSALTSVMGTSASLIDLTSIDKLATNQPAQSTPTARPRFRFVPSVNNDSILKEEPELEQQSTSSNRPYDNINMESFSSNRLSNNNANQQQQQQQQQQQKSEIKQQKNVAKPAVIHSSPLTRSTLFTQPEANFNHQNGNSAFKPPVSQQTNLNKSSVPNQLIGNNMQRSNQTTQNFLNSPANPIAHKKQQQQPPVPQVNRTESIHKPGVHVGITNPSGPPPTHGLIPRHYQPTQPPQFHQSMLNLSSIGASEPVHVNPSAIGMFGSRISLQQASPNFMKHPAYTPQLNKTNGHYSYPAPQSPPQQPQPQQQQQHHHPPMPFKPPVGVHEDPVIKYIQQMNGTSNVNTPLSNGYPNRSQPPPHPYKNQMSTHSAFPMANNGFDPSQRQQGYMNQVNIHKHHTPQHNVPVKSVYLASPAIAKASMPSTSSANIYHFNQSNSQHIPSSTGGGANVHHPVQRQNVTVTTYL